MIEHWNYSADNVLHHFRSIFRGELPLATADRDLNELVQREGLDLESTAYVVQVLRIIKDQGMLHLYNMDILLQSDVTDLCLRKQMEAFSGLGRCLLEQILQKSPNWAIIGFAGCSPTSILYREKVEIDTQTQSCNLYHRIYSSQAVSHSSQPYAGRQITVARTYP